MLAQALRFTFLVLFAFGLETTADTRLLREYTQVSGEIRGVALVAHGLNTNPERMLPLIEVLNKNGIIALNIALSGHREGSTIFWHSSEVWIQEMLQGFTAAKTLADSHGVPTYFMGYSLGGLVGAVALQRLPANTVQKMILLAPALRVTKKTQLMRALSVANIFIVPSFAPKTYRYRWFTSIYAYDSLFETQGSLNKGDWQRLNLPTLVIMDRKDELVSFNSTVRLTTRNHLSQWQVVEVEKNADTKVGYKHLILDEASLGKQSWQQLTDMIQSYLLGE